MVKRERSPSPTISGSSGPITEGAVRYAPMPVKCRKGHPGFQTNRRVWAEEEKRRMRQLNIEPMRVFIRDDGMVIDWKSPVPVMSDTLLPPVPTNNTSTRSHGQKNPEIINHDARPKHTPQSHNKAQRSFRSSASSSGPSAPPIEIIDVDSLDNVAPEPTMSIDKGLPCKPLPLRNISRATTTPPQPPQLAPPRRSDTPAPPLSIMHLVKDVAEIPPPLSTDEGILQRGALTFLQKYIRLFDRNRAALATSQPSPRTCAQRVRQGRADVITGLLSFPAGRKFLPSGPRDVEYDVVCLENTTDVLLICYAEEAKDDKGKMWACDQRFILRRKEWDAVDRSTAGIWPLVAVSHQMAIREKIPPLPRPITL